MAEKMIIDCISDLHGLYPKLEGGDLLIIAGDLTARDTQEEYDKFDNWLAYETKNYRKKIFIAGNHDNLLIKEKPRKYMVGYKNKKTEKFEYLCDSGTEFDGLKIWGSPWSLTFPGINPRCTAFTCLEKDMKKKFENVPSDIDILITHQPPYGILDEIYTFEGLPCHVGSKRLKDLITRTVPKLVVFGHIHEQGGSRIGLKDTVFVNASHVNERYKPLNQPVRVILPKHQHQRLNYAACK